MKRNLVEITTADTKKTYTFEVGGLNDNPQLWEVTINAKSLDYSGKTSPYSGTTAVVYLERGTLEGAGVVPQAASPGKPIAEPTETAEDLIIRLLNHLGFYPAD